MTKQPWIIVIDEEEIDSFILKRALTILNPKYLVTEINDGEEAVSFLELFTGSDGVIPDVIVTENWFKSVTLDDILVAIRSNPLTANTPILVMSTSIQD